MIPTIEQIVEDLAAGAITKEQATAWIRQRLVDKLGQERIMFAAFAMHGLLANGTITLLNDLVAQHAVNQADALVEALGRK